MRTGNHSLSNRLIDKAAEPARQNTMSAFKVRKAADCYLQMFLKYPSVGVFHSYSELLHAALLESNPDITNFTPQPKGFVINGKRYIPDCFYLQNKKRYFVEIKPRGKFTKAKEMPLTSALNEFDTSFLVVSNESLLKQSTKAKNWLHIVRMLVSARYETTIGEEDDIYDKLVSKGELTIADIVDRGNRIDGRGYEIALFRLAHQGLITLSLDSKQLSYETEVSLCG